jgi:murein DD-endopeptidase
MVSLALDLPSRRRNEQGPRFRGLKLLTALVALTATGAGGFYLGRRTAPERVAPVEPTAIAAAAPSGATDAPPAIPTAAAPAAAAVLGAAVAAPGAPAAPAGTPAGETAVPGLHRAAVTLRGAMEESIAAALPRDERRLAQELTQVVNRLLVWDLLISRDGRRGDQLEILYRPAASAAPGLPPSGEPVVEALRFASQKLGKTIAAYRFQPDGAKWARYYRADGTEVEERLVEGPIREYEQITSLLRDGRRHKGVDFKAPVGTPVYAPFDGVVARRNWNWSFNGNSLDVLDPATGRHAIFLHLDVVSKELSPGRKVKKGDLIANAGNSGRSYAPHLHYQLENSAGNVLDPFEVHKTSRGAIDPGKRGLFEAERARLDGLLAGTIPTASVPVTASVAQ